MKQLVIKNCLSLISNYNPDLSSKELDKIRYGLEGIYLTFTKLIVISIVAYFIGIFNEYALLLLTFNGMRLFGFGVHAKKSSHCLVSSSLFFLIFPIICKILIIPKLIKLVISVPLILLILMFAPADTEKRPLKNKKKRIIFKGLTTIIAIFYIILSFVIKNNTLSNCFIFAVVIQVIIILPITYRLFGVNYNNYKKYEVK